jgi:aspartate 1-decarboxylase
MLTILKSKIHGAIVTQSNVDYRGSITIDEALMEASGILPYEKVLVADVTSGERVETYAIAGAQGSGVIGANGATAKVIKVGDKVLIMAFAQMTPVEAKKFKPKIIIVDGRNRISRS